MQYFIAFSGRVFLASEICVVREGFQITCSWGQPIAAVTGQEAAHPGQVTISSQDAHKYISTIYTSQSFGFWKWKLVCIHSCFDSKWHHSYIHWPSWGDVDSGVNSISLWKEFRGREESGGKVRRMVLVSGYIFLMCAGLK